MPLPSSKYYLGIYRHRLHHCCIRELQNVSGAEIIQENQCYGCIIFRTRSKSLPQTDCDGSEPNEAQIQVVTGPPMFQDLAPGRGDKNIVQLFTFDTVNEILVSSVTLTEDECTSSSSGRLKLLIAPHVTLNTRSRISVNDSTGNIDNQYQSVQCLNKTLQKSQWNRKRRHLITNNLSSSSSVSETGSQCGSEYNSANFNNINLDLLNSNNYSTSPSSNDVLSSINTSLHSNSPLNRSIESHCISETSNQSQKILNQYQTESLVCNVEHILTHYENILRKMIWHAAGIDTCNTDNNIEIHKEQDQISSPVPQSELQLSDSTLQALVTFWFTILDRPFRITTELLAGNNQSQNQFPIGSTQLSQIFGGKLLDQEIFQEAVRRGLLSKKKLEKQKKQVAPVSLDHWEKEIVIWGCVEEDVSFDVEDSKSCCWSLGVRYARKHQPIDKDDIQQEQSSIQKTNIPVAACMVDLILEEHYNGNGKKQIYGNSLKFLDPMCGNGTIPLVLGKMLERMMQGVCDQDMNLCQENNHIMVLVNMDIVGTDLYNDLEIPKNLVQISKDSNGIQDIYQTNFTFLPNISTSHLPFPSNSIDLVLCDPPWGIRHSKFTTVNKCTETWVREWVRVCKWSTIKDSDLMGQGKGEGGLIGVDSICQKTMQKVLDKLEFDEGVIERVFCEPIKIRNSGFEECRFWLYRKVKESCSSEDRVDESRHVNGVISE